MPTVPTIETESVGIKPLRLPLQPSLAVDPSGLTRGLDVAADALERSQLQLSEIRISGAETAILNRWNARLVEDEDAYFKLGGKDAVESLDTFYQEIDDIVNEEMTNRLTTGTEKRLLRDALALRRMNNRSKMSIHSFKSLQQWDKETAFANRAAQYEAAANDPSPENLRLSRERVIDETNAMSKIDGFQPESKVAIQNAKTAVSTMYRVAVEALMPDQLARANSVFERYSKEMNFNDREAVNDRLRTFTVSQTSREHTEVISNMRDKDGTRLSLAEQLSVADNTVKDVEILELTRQKLVIRDNQVTTAEGKQRSDDYQFLGAGAISGAPVDQLRGVIPRSV